MKCQKETDKADVLRNHVSRTERELYGVLQSKNTQKILRGAGAALLHADHGPGAGVGAGSSEMPVSSQMFRSGSGSGIQSSSSGLKSQQVKY
jgi:hypothetical protein